MNKMNTKGGLFDLILLIAIIFVIFLFFAAALYAFDLLSGEVIGLVSLSTSDVNVTTAAENTFGAINLVMPTLRWAAVVIVIMMVLGIMVSAFLVKAHPVFFIVHISMTIVAVVMAVYVSNAYESILTSGNVLASTLQSFTGMNYIMLHLPVFITVIGIFGAVLLFVGITVDKESGGGVTL